MRVGLVGQKGNDRAASIVADLCARLAEMDADRVVDEATAAQLSTAASAGCAESVDAFDECDLVVSIGGDGTFLFTARGAGSTPIMGVNLGEVGFLNAIAPEDAVGAVAREVERYRETGRVEARDMPRLGAESDGVAVEPALNEIVVQGSHRGHGGGAELAVRVDGSLYTDGHADGVLVTTPTGSTAYNLSEGGPLVHPSVESFVVTEMCGQEGMPPLVLDTDAEITVEVTGADTAYVVSDGRARSEIDPPATVTLSRAGRPVRIAGPPLDFFAALGKLD